MMKVLGSCQVSEYVKERVLALRREQPGAYGNISCLRTNAQKYLVHYFRKGQLTKLFFLFPVRCGVRDPHSKPRPSLFPACHGFKIVSVRSLASGPSHLW